MGGPEVTGLLRMAVVKGKKLIVKLTLDDLDEIIGYIAAEANHTDDKKLQKELDHLYERLKTTMESYDDGIVKLTLSERTYRVELTSFALIGRHRLPPARR